MKHILATAAALTLAVGLGATPASAGPNLIVNGSFNDPAQAVGGWALYANGLVPGWTSNNDQTEVDNAGALGMACYTAGCQSAEADGSTFDTLSQLVTGLKPGTNYLLTWVYGDRPGSGPQQLNVSLGGDPVTSDFGTGANTWTVNSFIVSADNVSELLSFAAVNTSALGGNPSIGNEITDVSLVAAPEPVSVALLGAGLAGLGLIRRRKRA